MKKELVIEILIAVILIALVWSIYFLFFRYTTCSDDKCFSTSLVKCNKVIYNRDTPDLLITYKILGASNNRCNINVKLIQVKHGSTSMAIFENKEMICSISLGSLTMPESNLQNCNGELRQEIQEAIINNMHSQIIENLNGLSIIASTNPVNSSS